MWLILFSLLITPPPSGGEDKSHQERFAAPQIRLARLEEEASVSLQANPSDFQALRQRSVIRIKLGKLDLAAADLARASEINPASADIATDLAYVAWLRGDLAKAGEMAERALKLDPNQPSATYYLGRLILVTGGDLKRAVALLEQALELNPLDNEIRFDLLAAYRGLGDTIHAAVQLQILQAAYPPDQPRILYAEGLIAADLDQITVAVDRFRAALGKDPRLGGVRFDLAGALIRLEQWDEAAAVLDQVVLEQPQSAPAAHFHALSLYNAQRIEEAEREIDRALALAPGHAPTYTLRGVLLSARGDRTGSVAALRRAVQLGPADFDAQLYLGRGEFALRNLDRALTALSAAVRLRPSDPEARFFLATTLESLGRHAEALGEYRQLLAGNPNDVRGNVGLGALLLKDGALEEAVPLLKKTVELEPGHFEGRLALGRALFQRGDLEDALTQLRRAVQLRPKSVEAHYQLALTLQKAHRAEEARAEFAVVKALNAELRGTAEAGVGEPDGSAPAKKPDSIG